MRCDRLAECEFLLKMAMAVDYGGVFLWETDVAKGFIKVSESMLRHLGYTTKQTERSLRAWEELFVAEDWVIARETIDDCICNNKNEFTIQYRMIASDGKHCWFQSRGTFVRNNEGRATRILGAGIDISAQKASEAQLIRMIERYRKMRDQACLAQNTAGVGTWEYDIARGIVTFDGVYAGMTGRGSEEQSVPVNDWQADFIENSWGNVTAKIDQCLCEGLEEFELTYAVKHHADGIRRMLCRGRPRMGDGQPAGIIGAAIDITDRENHLIGISASEKFYRRFAEGVPIGAAVVIGERLHINNALANLTGYKNTELQSLDDWFRRCHPGNASQMREYYETAVIVNPSRHARINITSRDGYTKCLFFAGTMQDGMDIWTFRDITRSERNARLLQQSERIAGSGGWEIDCMSGVLHWTDGMYRLHETTPQEISITKERAIQFFLPEYQGMVRDALHNAQELGLPWDIKAEKITARGNRFWARSLGYAEVVGGVVVRIYGAMMDITTEMREQKLGRTGNFSKCAVNSRSNSDQGASGV